MYNKPEVDTYGYPVMQIYYRLRHNWKIICLILVICQMYTLMKIFWYNEMDWAISLLKAINCRYWCNSIWNAQIWRCGANNVSIFNKWFNIGKVPSIWLKADIVPVPKGSTNDPCVPLNYQGIHLLSCIYKVFQQFSINKMVSGRPDHVRVTYIA